jgi:hypothetical protein
LLETMPRSGVGLDCLDYWGLLACLVGETDLLEPDHLELSLVRGCSVLATGNEVRLTRLRTTMQVRQISVLLGRI